jgi:hypothetical protein
MDSDSLIFEPANQTFTAGETAPRNRVFYVEPAPAIDVMFDQLEYLVAHESNGCPSGCQECERLRQVEGWLLQPFRPRDRIYSA